MKLTADKRKLYQSLLTKKDYLNLRDRFHSINSRCRNSKHYSGVENRFKNLEEFILWYIDNSPCGFVERDQDGRVFEICRYADTGHYSPSNCYIAPMKTNKAEQACVWRIIDTVSGKTITAHRALVQILRDDFNLVLKGVASSYVNNDSLYLKRYKIQRVNK